MSKPARRGGSGNIPSVRLYDGDVVQVWQNGEWQEAHVEDCRTVRMEFEPQFLLAVTEDEPCTHERCGPQPDEGEESYTAYEAELRKRYEEK